MAISPDRIESAVNAGIIERDYHVELLTQSAKWTRIAGIQEEDLLLSLSDHCGDMEQQWFRRNRKALADGVCGLIYLGPFAVKGGTNVSLRMRTLVAAFMRNYVDARAYTCEDALSLKCSVLALNDFGAPPNEYIRNRIGSVILDRASALRSTIIHAPELDVVRVWYGDAVASLIEAAYVKVNVDA